MKTIKSIFILALFTFGFGVAQADSIAIAPPNAASATTSTTTTTTTTPVTITIPPPSVTPCNSTNCAGNAPITINSITIPANGPAPDAASMLTPAAAAADANAIANENMVLNPPPDPGVSFFVALSTCAPGIYEVRNPLADKFGETWLNQQIQGYDQKNICRVDITTPDNRVMHCGFDDKAIAQIVDQHFLSGMLQASTKDQSKDYIKSEQIWSDLKVKNCGF